MTRRTFLAATAGAWMGRASAQSQSPNIVLIYADDLGYGDLGCYGSRIRTPNLDTMAGEGTRFESFYSASAVCSPSRAALLTGRYPTRVGIPTVLTPQDTYGLPDSEITMAQMLKPAGYQTMCIGKWHLGSRPQYLPTNRGFDEYFGLPYSNDQSPCVLMHNTEVIEQPVQLSTLTSRYTAQAVDFIQRAKGSPFFLYMPHTAPHLPLAASAKFRNKSHVGLYGDVVQELDWSVGQVLTALKANGLDENTLVMFSSDNGPWFAGSAGRLRGRKGETWEGGMKEPFIARFPGRIPAGRVVHGMATTMDLMPTVAGLCGASAPPSLDGVDIWPMLDGEREEVDREAFLYFDFWNLQCARLGSWKLHLTRNNAFPWTPDPVGGRFNLPLPRPELYDLENDPEECYDAADDFPEVVADIQARIERLLPTFPDQVQQAWRDTFSRQVIDTASGALPIQRTP